MAHPGTSQSEMDADRRREPATELRADPGGPQRRAPTSAGRSCPTSVERQRRRDLGQHDADRRLRRDPGRHRETRRRLSRPRAPCTTYTADRISQVLGGTDRRRRPCASTARSSTSCGPRPTRSARPSADVAGVVAPAVDADRHGADRRDRGRSRGRRRGTGSRPATCAAPPRRCCRASRSATCSRTRRSSRSSSGARPSSRNSICQHRGSPDRDARHRGSSAWATWPTSRVAPSPARRQPRGRDALRRRHGATSRAATSAPSWPTSRRRLAAIPFAIEYHAEVHSPALDPAGRPDAAAGRPRRARSSCLPAPAGGVRRLAPRLPRPARHARSPQSVAVWPPS